MHSKENDVGGYRRGDSLEFGQIRWKIKESALARSIKVQKLWMNTIYATFVYKRLVKSFYTRSKLLL